jgi:predicted O-methyltransferase YrrM
MRIVNATNYSYSSSHAKSLRLRGLRSHMTTLTTPVCAAVAARLFAEATASETTLEQRYNALSPQEQARFVPSNEDYRMLYQNLKDFHLAVSRETAVLLYMLARLSRASVIVEFGTSFGVSTLHLAAALRDNGGGRLISTEFEPTKVAQASANIAAAGLADLVEIRSGDAVESLARGLPERIDFVLLDGAKSLYPKILSLLEPNLPAGALIVADNANWSAAYLARVRDPAAGYMSVPIGGDVEVTFRL